ncbi:DUF4192 domain-containing protein [Nocardiopsis sp. N85]|uniref:DUF4192 domain-containing protein n=1 Tax=Nocardiopsis sp. N85 TaxID=3029400 RepID=UPI00237F16EA|nr:DUF4192 domain-containing protein [Nocardiopsis sp. N85]MDE3721480.1 DUF4192 domain-containing protein [Nocardiopsis sp. N85]
MGGRLALRSPIDIIAGMPYIVGEPPDPGIVVLAAKGAGVHAAFCGALDGSHRHLTPAQRARPPVDLAVAEGCGGLLIVAYGPPGLVTPYVDALLLAARERGVAIIDALRVTDGRYWSYTCVSPSCCPPGGTVVDIDSSPVPAGAVLRGIAPARPLRVALADLDRVRGLLTPVGGEARAAMDALAEEVDGRARAMSETTLVRRGFGAVREAIEAERDGDGIRGYEEIAWLGVHLAHLRIRDRAWAAITERTALLHRDLWARVARHLPARRRAAPAALTAVAAWQHGDDALAMAAVETALAADPGYSMAVLMGRALAWGLPVERWRGSAPEQGPWE